MQAIDITGIDKARLLKALHDNTRAMGMGALHDLKAAIDSVPKPYHPAIGLYFDYFHGRPLKVRLDGDTLDVRLYDRDAGVGAGAIAVASCR